MDLKETGCKGVNWTEVVQDRVQWWAFNNNNEFLHQPFNYGGKNLKYLSRVVSWRSRCRHADNCCSTRPPTKKYRLVLFFFPFSVRNSLMACSWDRFVTCVPQHMLLSTPSIVTTRTCPLWSSGSPLVLT